jgi:hypothetical protein
MQKPGKRVVDHAGKINFEGKGGAQAPSPVPMQHGF